MAFRTALDGVAIVTGAAKGIGQETVFAFAEAGASGVLVADINRQGARETAEKSKQYAKHPEYRAVSVAVDVTDADSVQVMVYRAIKEFGRIDYSVNSAGITGGGSMARITDLPIDEYERINDINAKGTMLCVRAVSKAMIAQEPISYKGRHGPRSLGRGSIINLGSAASYMASEGMLSYVASKHAVIGITKSAAIDNIRHHIRVNAICPSWVNTPMMHLKMQQVPKLEKFVEKMSPLGRMATVEEVAEIIVFMCSGSASYVNGTGLLVDAGLSLTAHTGKLISFGYLGGEASKDYKVFSSKF